jgi:hypothetical protein
VILLWITRALVIDNCFRLAGNFLKGDGFEKQIERGGDVRFHGGAIYNVRHRPICNQPG